MTGAELRRRLEALGLSPLAAARRWGAPYRTVCDWIAGRSRVPAILAHLLALEEGSRRPWHEVKDDAATIRRPKDTDDEA